MDKLISHRGNLDGPTEFENLPSYIDQALTRVGFVEIDLWLKDGFLFLGHDGPTYQIESKWLFVRESHLLIHAKNVDALVWLREYMPNAHYFFHSGDEATLTSKGLIWVKDPNYPASTHIIVPRMTLSEVIDLRADMINFRYRPWAVCSDYVGTIRDAYETVWGISELCGWLSTEQNLCEGAEGNVSGRVDDSLMFITKSGANLESVFWDDLVRFGPGADSRHGVPSSEHSMHEVLLKRYKYVVHYHTKNLPPLVGKPNVALHPDYVSACNGLPLVVDYKTPGEALGKEVSNLIRDLEDIPKVLWLKNHGVVVCGDSVNEVQNTIVVHEKHCQLLGSQSNILTSLTSKEIKKILKSRTLSKRRQEIRSR